MFLPVSTEAIFANELDISLADTPRLSEVIELTSAEDVGPFLLGEVELGISNTLPSNDFTLGCAAIRVRSHVNAKTVALAKFEENVDFE